MTQVGRPYKVSAEITFKDGHTTRLIMHKQMTAETIRTMVDVLVINASSKMADNGAIIFDNTVIAASELRSIKYEYVEWTS